MRRVCYRISVMHQILADQGYLPQLLELVGKGISFDVRTIV